MNVFSKNQVRIFVNLKIIPKNDRDDFHKDNRVNQVVDLLLNDNTLLYKEIVNVINNIFDIHNFLDYIQILNKLYVHPELSDKLSTYIIFLWHIYNDKTQCANLRGALLERLVYKLLEKKYGNDCDSHISCYICINSWISQKSVDVFFYIADEDLGESFECKVNPDAVEGVHINNLKQIFIKSNEKIYPSIVSFSSRKALALRLKELKIPVEPVQLFGWENLKEIAINSLPMPT